MAAEKEILFFPDCFIRVVNTQLLNSRNLINSCLMCGLKIHTGNFGQSPEMTKLNLKIEKISILFS